MRFRLLVKQGLNGKPFNDPGDDPEHFYDSRWLTWPRTWREAETLPLGIKDASYCRRTTQEQVKAWAEQTVADYNETEHRRYGDRAVLRYLLGVTFLPKD